jgi:hypothetical protein
VIDFLKENFIEIALEGWLDALSSTEGEVYGIF